MKLQWSERALADLAEAAAYARLQSSALEQGLLTVLSRGLDHLLLFPDSGKPGRLDGTRELHMPDLPYFIVYQVRGESLRVLRVYHSARRWPSPSKKKA